METTGFGTIRFEDGQATLPVGPGLLQPASIDMLATIHDREAMAAAAAFIDHLPRHLDTVRRNVMARLDAAPDHYARLFPELVEGGAVSADGLWYSLVLTSLWTDEERRVTMEFGLDGASDGTVLTAVFTLDGTLRALDFT